MTDSAPLPPLVNFEPHPANAPVLRYDLPAGSVINGYGLMPLDIPSAYFRPLETTPASVYPSFWLVDAVKASPPAASSSDSADARLSELQFYTVPLYVAKDPGHGPMEMDVDKIVSEVLQPQTTLNSATGFGRVPVLGAGAPTLAGRTVVPMMRVTGDARPPNLGSAYTAVLSVTAQARVLTRDLSLYGRLRLRAVTELTSPRYQLSLVEHYKLASYPGDYGATRTVGTFTLLPGEKTTLTLSQTENRTETRDITTNVLDSYTETSANELEHQVNQEQGVQTGSADKHEEDGYSKGSSQQHVSMSASASFFGLVKASMEGSLDFKSEHGDSHRDTSSRTSNVSTLTKGMDKHVEQSSNARSYQASTGTHDTTQVSTGTVNTTTRELQNINYSRVLNFVIRQLSQEYLTITSLDDVTVVLSDGTLDGTRTTSIELLDEFLASVIVEDHQQEVKAKIINTLWRVRDWQGQLVPFLEFLDPSVLPSYPEAGWPPSSTSEAPTRYRKNSRLAEKHGQAVSLGKTNLGEDRPPLPVNGVVLDVRTRVLQTNNVIVDALLGQGDALDEYNIQLQAAAVDKARVANAERQLAIDIVKAMKTPDDQVNAYRSIFYPPDTDKNDVS